MRAPAIPSSIAARCRSTLTRELAAAFAGKGANYVDAPVAGTVQSVVDRSISVMVGADEGTFARLAPLLDCMAGTVQHCGESGGPAR